MSYIKNKANLLLVELKSLKECDYSNNSIGAYALLNEILKDAELLAKNSLDCPIEASKRLKIEQADLDNRSKRAMQRSRDAIARSNAILGNVFKMNKAA